MDETNCNLFLRRSQGRSRRGTRCSVKAATSRGPNIHVIGAISQTGLVYWERRRGSFLKEDCAEWLRQALRRCEEPYHQGPVSPSEYIHVILTENMTVKVLPG